MYSNDRKLGRKEGGQGTPETTPSCSSRTPVLNENLTDHRKPTGSPQTLPHSLDSIKQWHRCHYTTPPTHWHDPLPGWVEQHHLHTIANSSHADRLPSSRTLPAIAPGSSSSLTDRLGLGWARVRVGGAWQKLVAFIAADEGPRVRNILLCQKFVNYVQQFVQQTTLLIDNVVMSLYSITDLWYVTNNYSVWWSRMSSLLIALWWSTVHNELESLSGLKS